MTCIQLIIMDTSDDELQQRVKQIFAQKSAISLTINSQHGQSVTLYKEDYQSLLPHRWLRTQAVDVLIKLLLQRQREEMRKSLVGKGHMKSETPRTLLRVMDAFVVTLIMTDQEDFILESLQPLELFNQSTKYLLIPLNTEFASGSHWLLGLLIRKEDKYKLVIFDSGSGGDIGKELCFRLGHLYSVLMKKEMKVQMAYGQNLIYQTNGYDCGVFSVGYSEYIMKEVLTQIEEEKEAQFDNFSKQYKYLLSNSTHTRKRYRRLLEEEIIKSVCSQDERQQ